MKTTFSVRFFPHQEAIPFSSIKKAADSPTAQATHGTMLRTTMDGLPLDFASRRERMNESF